MTLQLRHYQVEARRRAYAAWKAAQSPEERRQLVVLPTGTGKTICALNMVVDAIARGSRVVWLAHREELIKQPYRALCALWPEHAIRAGIVKAGRDEHEAQLVFGSIGTVQRRARLQRILDAGPIRLVVVDEAHHSVSGSWARVLDEVERHAVAAGLRPPLVLGLTATPYRADGRPLGQMWRVAHSYPIRMAIDAAYLVPPRFVVDRLPLDLSGVEVSKRGDYNKEQLEDALLEQGIVDHTVASLDRHGRGRRVVVFTVTIRQAQLTAAALAADGWRAYALSGETPAGERESILTALEDGRVECVCNAGVLTEGTDITTIDCVVLARPTRSKGLFVQVVGRGLRVAPEKSDCMVLDLAGASDEHDLTVPAALLEHGAPETEAEDKESTGGEGGRSVYEGMRDERRRVAYTWVPVPGLDRRAYALDAGKEGRVALIECPEEGGWRPVVMRRGKGSRTDPLVHGVVSLELAQGLGADFVRQVDAATLSRRGASWRQQEPTEGQMRLLGKLRIATEPSSSGDAADLITAKLARGDIVRRGLAARVLMPSAQLRMGAA